jgi:hypothetical protein
MTNHWTESGSLEPVNASALAASHRVARLLLSLRIPVTLHYKWHNTWVRVTLAVTAIWVGVLLGSFLITMLCDAGEELVLLSGLRMQWDYSPVHRFMEKSLSSVYEMPSTDA